jgi:hypothetical protein
MLASVGGCRKSIGIGFFINCGGQPKTKKIDRPTDQQKVRINLYKIQNERIKPTKHDKICVHLHRIREMAHISEKIMLIKRFMNIYTILFTVCKKKSLLSNYEYDLQTLNKNYIIETFRM